MEAPMSLSAAAPAAAGSGENSRSGSGHSSPCAPSSSSPAASSCGLAEGDSSPLPPPPFPSEGPLDLSELVDGIKYHLTVFKGVHLSKRLGIQDLLRRFDPSSDLNRYAHFDMGKKYTRNLIATDNETFTLMLLCWTPGKESPVHDHPCDGCWVRVCEGTVCETQYQRDTERNKLVETTKSVGTAGDVMYIDDSIALHKVGNPSETERACTLHLYAPPFRTCSIWLEGESTPLDKAMRPTVTYYSEFGEVVDYEQSSLCR